MSSSPDNVYFKESDVEKPVLGAESVQTNQRVVGIAITGPVQMPEGWEKEWWSRHKNKCR